jgi:hypothetical protein
VLKKHHVGTLKLNCEGLAKDRLCMQGDLCAKVPGVPTYSPCVDWAAFLLVVAVAALLSGHMLQCDVVNAFVQAALHSHQATPRTYMPVPARTRHIFLRHLHGFRAQHRYVRVLRAL